MDGAGFLFFLNLLQYLKKVKICNNYKDFFYVVLGLGPELETN
jgi:hypothetical protein